MGAFGLSFNRLNKLNLLSDSAPSAGDGTFDACFINDRYRTPTTILTDFSNMPGLSASGGANGTVIRNGSIVAATAPRIGDTGLLVEQARTNLYQDSLNPATQTVTVASGTTYTVSCVGTGSIALSGAGTGTVTEGSPVTLTASSTSLTCTVTGALEGVNVEAGSFATSIIVTPSGSSATRTDDVVSLTDLSAIGLTSSVLTDGYSIYAEANYTGADQGFPWVYEINQAASPSQNRLGIFRNNVNDGLGLRVDAGGSQQAGPGAGSEDGSVFKIAARIETNNIQTARDGALVGSDASATLPIGLDRLQLGAGSNGIYQGWRIRRFAIVPRPLTNTELQSLTNNPNAFLGYACGSSGAFSGEQFNNDQFDV